MDQMIIMNRMITNRMTVNQMITTIITNQIVIIFMYKILYKTMIIMDQMIIVITITKILLKVTMNQDTVNNMSQMIMMIMISIHRILHKDLRIIQKIVDIIRIIDYA